MKALWRIFGLAAVAGLAAGCEALDGFDPDGGGGGSGGGSFSQGFVFVRNRDVQAVDESGDPNSPLRLTTQGGAYEPTVAPNGRSVAYVYRSGSTVELRSVPTTGQGQPSTVFALTASSCPGCSNARFPVFNPASNVIVFTVYRGNTSSLAKVNADGSGFVLFNNGNIGITSHGAASFFPNGQTVLSAGGASANQLNQLVRTNVMSGASEVYSFNLGNEAQVVANRVAVSPDGTQVAFDGQTSSGTTSIFLASLGQILGSVKQLTRHTGESGVSDTWPSWRGNTEVTFLSNAGGNDNIYRISIATTGAGTLVVPSALEPSYGGS